MWRGALAAATGMLLLASARIVMAAEHGGEHHTPSVSELFFPVINFAIFLWVIRRAGGGAIRDYLHVRHQQIVSDVDAAAATIADARRRYDEIRARLDGVAGEAEQIRKDLHAMAEVERDRRRKIVEAAAAHVRSDSRTIADHEVQAARTGLRKDMVETAVAETLAMLRRQLKDVDRERFVKEFLGSMQSRA